MPSLGYSVLVTSYPIGKQLGETEHEKQGQAAVRELVQVIRYLKEHEQELSVDMDDYAIFGFSAGGMMTTAYSFANYEYCCHKVKLPRPKVIFPMYGLDWNVKALEQDKGLAVFSIAGREDEYGFGNVEKRQALGGGAPPRARPGWGADPPPCHGPQARV